MSEHLTCSHTSRTSLPGANLSSAAVFLTIQVGCLEELGRLHQTASDATAERPDWTHIFCSVLPPLPVAPTSPACAGGGGSGSDVFGESVSVSLLPLQHTALPRFQSLVRHKKTQILVEAHVGHCTQNVHKRTLFA
jgi:hypothetical protein